jgi:hypothetical protein
MSPSSDKAKPEPCDSCAVVRACAHFGIAAYLVSCCNAKQTRFSKIFILSFAAGLNLFSFFFRVKIILAEIYCRLSQKVYPTNFKQTPTLISGFYPLRENGLVTLV